MKVLGNIFPKFYSSMYYMRKIAEYKTGTPYTGRKSSNKYLKDWHTADTGNTPETHKYNLWYLRRIAQVYDPEFDMESNENQCLQTILERISSTTTVRLTLSSNTAYVDDEITLTALVLDENREPIKNATVTFTDGDEYTETATTGNDGKATQTYTASSVGSILFTATYDEYSSSNTLTVSKHTSSLTMSAEYTEMYIGGKVTFDGYLLIDGVGVSGKTVDIYVLTDEDTWSKYDTVTTTDGGAYHYNKYGYGSSESIVTYRMTYDGDSQTEGINSNTIAITVTKVPTTLTIETPTIVYSDAFSVNGKLSRADNLPINTDITLVWRDNDGNSGTATVRTDLLGNVTFSRSEPTTVTQYTFQLVFDGSSTLQPSQSAQIYVDVNKETAVLNITSPTTGSSVGQADSITVAGTLKDNDDEILEGMKVYAKLGGTTLETFIVDNTGAISGTLYASDLNTGANNIEFIFYDTTEYTRSTQTVVVNKGITYTKLEVEATKPILSYADSPDVTDMTAQLLDNNDDPVQASGVTIYFKDGATTLGSAQTDATGKATLLNAYTSQGRGDVQITVDDGSLVTETYSIEDCIRYDSTDYVNVETIKNWDLPSQFKLSFKILSDSWSGTTGSSNVALIRFNSSSGVWCGKGASSNRNIYAPNGVTLTSIPANTDVEYTLTYDNSNCSFTDGTSTVTTTASLTKVYSITAQESSHAHLKNIKIKPL